MFVSLFVVVVKYPANSSELFPDCLEVMLFVQVLRHSGGDCIFERRCLFVAVGLYALFTVLPQWDNMA